MMKSLTKKKFIYNITIIAVFAALEFIFTSFIAIPIGFGGYLNFSDLFVFLMASLVNPIVGGLVGGISSSLSDLYLGYAFYAPFTFFIKFIEGLIAGYLFKLLVRKEEIKLKDCLISVICFIIGGIIMAGLYMLPDYLQYVYLPNMEIPSNIVYVLFLDFAFNLIQGTINGVIAGILLMYLYPIYKKLTV